MFEIILSKSFQDYFYAYGYVGIYVWFITIDQLVPIPEEITLIVIGYFASHGFINPVIAGVFAVLAFMTVDTVYFQLTKSGNKFFRKLRNRSEKQHHPIREKLTRNMGKTLLVLCFIPRMRLLAPVYIALAKIPYRKFILYDALSLVLFATVYVGIGIIFHKSLSVLIKDVERYQNLVFGIAMVIMTIVTLIIVRKRKS